MNDFKDILNKLSFSEHLTAEEAEFSMNAMMSEEADTNQIASFMTAMRIKGETVDELTSFAKVMREKSLKVDVDVDGAVDIVGTGGDKSGTFNISTISAFVIAGAGVPVIKHGNRSASSKCGSADVLEQLGAVIELDNIQVAKVYNEVGMAFMFAPMFHPALKYVMPARKSLGFRTFFNILGPLANPAGVKRYVIGVYSKELALTMIQILANLDAEFAYTFNSHDGLDELSLAAQAEVFELKNNLTSSAFTFDPQSLGFQKVNLDALLGGEPEGNGRIFTNILDNNATQAQKDIVLLNSAFAIKVSGKVESLSDAKAMAEESLSSGKAKKIFNHFIETTQSV